MGAADKLLSLFLYGNACVVAAVGKAHFRNISYETELPGLISDWWMVFVTGSSLDSEFTRTS
jgi:hypothetical protein